jgi:tetratricopeptide (TPR) repeat protein
VSLRGLSLILAVGLLASTPSRAFAAPDARELKAREDFAAGRYEAALEIFARLYAETLHPNYLRNIGRCYQNLGEPDRAITSFRDYLRKAKDVTPDERAEIDGYIKEMQELKRQRNGVPPPGPPETASAAASPARTGVAPPAAPPPASTTTVNVSMAAPPPTSSSSSSNDSSPAVYERWWFWAIVAGAVGAGLGVAAAAGAFTHTNEPACPTGFRCGQ